ncbi:MAG: copper transporter [Actinobacteria bacterium]|nr:copper transporter [Actinomycetota bacterium]
MISFRFHLVSLTAVFLALALGIVLGATVVNQATVKLLDDRIATVRKEAADARGALSLWSKFGDDAETALVTGRLEGVRVLTVAPETLSSDITDKMHAVLAAAGAIDAGTVRIDNAWSDESPTTLADIGESLGIVGPTSLDTAIAAAAARLAQDFLVGGGPTLPALAAKNLVHLDSGDGASAPGEDARILVLEDGPPSGLLEPLVRALGASMPARVLVADGGPDEEIGVSLVGVLRETPDNARLSTVDHIRSTQGRVAAVLALRDFDRLVIGDYGSGPGADRAAPAAGG